MGNAPSTAATSSTTAATAATAAAHAAAISRAALKYRNNKSKKSNHQALAKSKSSSSNAPPPAALSPLAKVKDGILSSRVSSLVPDDMRRQLPDVIIRIIISYYLSTSSYGIHGYYNSCMIDHHGNGMITLLVPSPAAIPRKLQPHGYKLPHAVHVAAPVTITSIWYVPYDDTINVIGYYPRPAVACSIKNHHATASSTHPHATPTKRWLSYRMADILAAVAAAAGTSDNNDNDNDDDGDDGNESLTMADGASLSSSITRHDKSKSSSSSPAPVPVPLTVPFIDVIAPLHMKSSLPLPIGIGFEPVLWRATATTATTIGTTSDDDSMATCVLWQSSPLCYYDINTIHTTATATATATVAPTTVTAATSHATAANPTVTPAPVVSANINNTKNDGHSNEVAPTTGTATSTGINEIIVSMASVPSPSPAYVTHNGRLFAFELFPTSRHHTHVAGRPFNIYTYHPPSSSSPTVKAAVTSSSMVEGSPSTIPSPPPSLYSNTWQRMDEWCDALRTEHKDTTIIACYGVHLTIPSLSSSPSSSDETVAMIAFGRGVSTYGGPGPAGDSPFGETLYLFCLPPTHGNGNGDRKHGDVPLFMGGSVYSISTSICMYHYPTSNGLPAWIDDTCRPSVLYNRWLVMSSVLSPRHYDCHRPYGGGSYTPERAHTEAYEYFTHTELCPAWLDLQAVIYKYRHKFRRLNTTPLASVASSPLPPESSATSLRGTGVGSHMHSSDEWYRYWPHTMDVIFNDRPAITMTAGRKYW